METLESGREKAGRLSWPAESSGWGRCLGENCFFNSLTNTARKCPFRSQSLFLVSCCYPDN